MAKRSARFHHCFQAPAARVWQGLADTARYNEAAGFPAHNITEIAQADGTQLFRGSARIGPLAVTWDDRPTNWIRDRWLEHTRLFERGPLARLTGRLTLTPDGGGRCEGVHEIEVEPRGLAGRAVAAFLLSKGRQAFERLAAQAEAWARGERAVPFDPPAPDLPVNAKRRAERIAAELVAAGHAAGPADRLLRLVLAGGETDVTRIRPLALARAWGEPPEAVVALCLDATKRGLLSLSWDLLCPRCRGAKVRAPSLDKLPQGAHCPTCAVDYDRDFSRNCEATFRPAEAIRPLAGGEFCLLGPMGMPHILAHLTLAPGERREVPLDLPPGPYRFRTLEPGPEAALDYAGGPPPSVRYDGAAIAAEPGPGRGTGLVLANASPHLRTFVVEDRSWVADALTGDRLTAMQPFRDLFSDQVLRPGDEVGIGRIAILFTDLRGSTALYERIGDAAAYRRVREHFGYLAAIVRQHEGAIVKTIGDAVMAAFADPAQSVAAALAMQDHIGDLNRSSAGPPLVLKLGVHAGPCIAVTLNDRLDYFGRAVNLAARLLDASQGADVVLSADLAAEPKVAGLLEGRRLERGKTELRGFVGAVPFVQVAVGQGRWKGLRIPDRRTRKIASLV